MIGESPYKRYLIWLLLGIALLCGFMIFWYTDIGDTLDNAVLLVESIAKGKFFDYYEYAALNSAPESQYSANYNVLLYAIFAIWNLPTVIVHLITGSDYMNSFSAQIWCKMIVVAAFVGIFLVVHKLTKKLGGTKEDGLFAGFLSVSSLCVFVPALVASQYDCLSLLFMLLGLYFYSERKTWQFLLMFAIAVPLKMFAIFIFIPMLLIRYKNVLKILGMTALVMIPSFLLELPFKADPYYSVAMDSQNGDAVKLLLDATVSIGTLKINLFIIAYILLCFFCYVKRGSDCIKEGRLAVYFSFAVFGAFCVLVPIRSYWIVLYTPFMALLAALKKGNRTIPVIVDTVAGFAGGIFILANHWIYNTGNIASRLVLNNVTLPDGTEQKYGHFRGFLESLGMPNLKYAFFAVFAGAVIFGLWYFYPEKDTAGSDIHRTAGEFWAMISRPVILISVTALLVYCNFASQPDVKYGSDSYDKASEVMLMDGDTASRTIQFEENETLSELTVWLKTRSVNRSARSFVGLRITEASTGTVLWEDSVGIAVIDDDGAVTFELDGIGVLASRTYKLEMYGIDAELSRSGDVSPYLDKNGELAILFR